MSKEVKTLVIKNHYYSDEDDRCGVELHLENMSLWFCDSDNLGHQFNDCYRIKDMIMLAYQLGKDGYELNCREAFSED